MALLDDVKRGIGVFYSDVTKDAEVQRMINGAIAYFSGAGWDVSTPDALATDAIILHCKMAQSTDPAQSINHPLLISMIAQGRAKVANTAATPTASPVAGSYVGAQSITITCTTDDVEIRYTADGSIPTNDSDLYYGPISVDESMTIKAVAYRYGFYASAMLTAAYVIA